nr:delta-1-pyrroline-5-carboxylate synthase-like [Tanacetum cinerariifolium]
RDHQPKGTGDVVEQGEEREGREPCLVPTSLIFGRIIDIQQISNVGFPEHYFNFAAYNELLARANVSTLAKAIRALANMEEPIGQVLKRTELSDGFILEKMSSPLGVLVIVESRPEALV